MADNILSEFPTLTERNEAIARYYSSGHSLSRTGERFGIAKQTVWVVLKHFGDGPRPRSYYTFQFPKLRPNRRTSMYDRFWKKVAIKDPDSCWEWQGRREERGYGRFRIGRKLFFAHRIAWYFTTRQIIRHLLLHTCDNPTCCNPSHLYDGTAKQNSRDFRERGKGTGQINRLSASALRFAVKELQCGKSYKDVAKTLDVDVGPLHAAIRGNIH